MPRGRRRSGCRAYEISFGHSLWQIQRSEPRATGVQGMYTGARIVPGVAELRQRLAEPMPMRLEVFRSGGEVVAMGSPVILYDSEAAIAAVTDAMEASGANVANSHATSLKAVGIKEVGPRDVAFKRESDPHGLLNPGKFDLDAAAGIDTNVGARLNSSGWGMRSRHAAAS